MASRFQAGPLVAAPCYPNSIAWSDENLIAVASGHLVTIINPALPIRPQGIITIATSEPFPIGRIERNDLLSGCLLPISLSRDCRPCVKSISWSPLGMAPNAGCLLAVCTTDGHVKLYRSPFCDFTAEYIEIMDLSSKLYDYLASINFGESDVPSSKFPVEEATEDGDIANMPTLASMRKCKRQKIDAPSMNNNGSGASGNNLGSYGSCLLTDLEAHGLHTVKESNLNHVSLAKSKAKPPRKIQENSTLPLINANQYYSRSAMLSSLAVAWSPILHFPHKDCPLPQNGSSFCILAVGGKLGKISLWKMYPPECYSIEDNMATTTIMLVGLFQAHNSWISSVTWALLDSDTLDSKVLLATGSTDGSVRIWQAYKEELIASSETNFASFSLLKEVTPVDTGPVSVLTLTVPAQTPHKQFLAVGRGSGLFEVWICDISRERCDKAGSYDVHDHVVTGLSWSFDGRHLYSCSEDNLLHSWNLGQSSFSQVSFPPSVPHLRSFIDLPDTFRSCFGVSVSPGNLVFALVRTFDVDLLNPMYEARAHKAVVEFFWIGGQQLNLMPTGFSDSHTETCPTNSEKELIYWESNIMWSLKQYESLDRPLVVWDIVAALLAFRKAQSRCVECILLKWLGTSYVGYHVELSSEKILLLVSRNLSKFSTRQLHLLNIICRRIVLSELKPEIDEMNYFEEDDGIEEEQVALWMELLLNSEKELRQRLVGLSFSAFLRLASYSPTTSPSQHWYPVGLTEMLQWVELNRDKLTNSLNILASEAGIHQKRLQSGKDVAEQCNFCSASVPFESPEEAFCHGAECNSRVSKRHKLTRCAISMQVCPTTPLWFCMCCSRYAFRLAPDTLFTMPNYPSDFKSSKLSDCSEVYSKPLCPFCGILLQRQQLDFLLSSSPV